MVTSKSWYSSISLCSLLAAQLQCNNWKNVWRKIYLRYNLSLHGFWWKSLACFIFLYWATKKKYDACIERKAEVHNHSPNEDTTLLNEFFPIYLLLCSSLCNYLPICMPLLFSLSHTYCTEFCEGKTKQLYSWVLNMSEHLPQV